MSCTPLTSIAWAWVRWRCSFSASRGTFTPGARLRVGGAFVEWLGEVEGLGIEGDHEIVGALLAVV